MGVLNLFANATKRIAKLSLYRLGLLRLALGWSRRPIVAVYTFHRVTDQSRSPRYPLDYDMGQDVKEFVAQLDVIGDFFNILSLEEFEGIISGRRAPEGHSVLLTFDDGDSEFVDHVLPELQARHWPAVVFSPTDFIEEEVYFWHVWLGHILLDADRERMGVFEGVPTLPDSVLSIVRNGDLSTSTGRRRITVAVADELNTLKDDQILQIVERIKERFRELGPPAIHCMNWAQHRRLIGAGISVQSHTASHRRLATLDREEIASELLESKRRLEAELGQAVVAICYPQGSFNEVVLEESKRAGYTLAFTTMEGVCTYPAGKAMELSLPRMSVWGNTPAECHWSLFRQLFVGKG